MPSPKVSTADREFFEALADVVFGNPFTAQRTQLILRLVPGTSRWNANSRNSSRAANPSASAMGVDQILDEQVGEAEEGEEDEDGDEDGDRV